MTLLSKMLGLVRNMGKADELAELRSELATTRNNYTRLQSAFSDLVRKSRTPVVALKWVSIECSHPVDCNHGEDAKYLLQFPGSIHVVVHLVIANGTFYFKTMDGSIVYGSPTHWMLVASA